MAINAKLITEKDTYGQIELNQVAFRRDGRIVAQYPLANGIEYVENGMLLGVDYVNKTIKYPDGTLPVALNYTTEHMYDERFAHGLKHFKLDKGTFCPRLGILAAGDKFTTNAVCYDNATSVLDSIGTSTVVYGKACTTEGFKGYIELTTTKPTGTVLQAIEKTKMPDRSDAIKFVVL